MANPDQIQNDDPDQPQTIWKTIMGRAVFGFYVEAVRVEYFWNDEYLQKLCDVENGISAKWGKLIFYTLLVCLIGLTSVYGTIGDIEIRGFSVSQVPFLSEFCIFILGFAVSLQVIFMLDVIALGLMRRELFKITGSEVPNMRMVHMKGDSAWIDAIIPKFIGYSSGWFHKLVNLISNLWSVLLPIVPMLSVIAVQIVCLLSVLETDYGALSALLSYAGIGFSAISVLVFFVTLFVPMPFKFQQLIQPEVPENVFNPSDDKSEI